VAAELGPQTRSAVATRAGHRCEYCLIAEEDAGFRHEIDHIVSRKHGGLSGLDNLAFACVLCNRSKGSDIASIDPVAGRVTRLFHPRRDRWEDHFAIEGRFIRGFTEVGRATVSLLRLNHPDRLAERGTLQLLRRYPIGSSGTP
jgi:hypothetical protein